MKYVEAWQCPVCLESFAKEHFSREGPCKDCEQLTDAERRDLFQRSVECYSWFAVPPVTDLARSEME